MQESLIVSTGHTVMKICAYIAVFAIVFAYVWIKWVKNR